MKKLVCFALVLGLVFAPMSVFARVANTPPPIRVTVEGDPLEFEGQQPIRVGENVLGPIRDIFESLGYEVNWCSYTNTVVVTKPTQPLMVADWVSPVAHPETGNVHIRIGDFATIRSYQGITQTGRFYWCDSWHFPRSVATGLSFADHNMRFNHIPSFEIPFNGTLIAQLLSDTAVRLDIYRIHRNRNGVEIHSTWHSHGLWNRAPRRTFIVNFDEFILMAWIDETPVPVGHFVVR